LSTKETVIQKTIKSQRGTLAMKNSWAWHKLLMLLEYRWTDITQYTIHQL
jgi:hypothetical protein